MKNQPQNTVELGELILAVLDEAEQYRADPRETARQATDTVADMLWGASELPSSPPPPRFN